MWRGRRGRFAVALTALALAIVACAQGSISDGDGASVGSSGGGSAATTGASSVGGAGGGGVLVPSSGGGGTLDTVSASATTSSNSSSSSGSGGCGDGVCTDGVESCSTCEADCGPCSGTCGNDTCDAGETCQTCADDCPGVNDCDGDANNGCECLTSGCCGSACETAHDNGLGQQFFDCVALGTIDVAQAQKAAIAWPTAGSLVNGSCTGPGQNEVLCKQGTSSCACWGVAGTNAGRVALNSASDACNCPGASDAVWN